jgi:formiminotetrahydrofolate cyclodeaminase
MAHSLIATLDADRASWANVGPTAAIVTALAAGVVAEAARRSADVWDDAAGAAAQATALRRRAIRVAQDDREAHLAAREALQAARAGEGGALSDGTLAVTLARAADLPLEIATAGADTAELGALVTEHGSADVRADAAGAAALAAGAVDAATELIEVNLSTGSEDERLVRALELRRAASAASQHALIEST